MPVLIAPLDCLERALDEAAGKMKDATARDWPALNRCRDFSQNAGSVPATISVGGLERNWVEVVDHVCCR